MESAAPAPHPGYARATPDLLACPRCQAHNLPGSIYCYSCGFPLEDADPANATGLSGVAIYAQARPGGFWVRSLAMLVDLTVVILTFTLLFVFLSGESINYYFNSVETTSWDYFDFLLTLLYFTLGIGLWAATPGKRLLGLRVVRPDGGKVGIGRALVRFLAYYLSALILGIGFFMIAFRRDKRGLHDLICDTVVIRGRDQNPAIKHDRADTP